MKKSFAAIIAIITVVMIALTATAEKKLWIYSNDGNHLSIEVSKFDSISTVEPTEIPDPEPVAEKCNASDYPQVTIGTQTWMAENYRCSKYDTESEAYNASWLTNNTVPTSTDAVYTPYYTDAADKTKWSSTEYAGNLSEEQITKLGYLYNWSAAVGVEDGQNQASAFTGNRQGICPNGWHVPTRAEWQTLYDYIYSGQNLSSNEVGKYLKSTSGWYENGNGTDSYDFATLPSGSAYGSSVLNIGRYSIFWTATSDESISIYAYYRYLSYNYDHLSDSKNNYLKFYGQSVRCLKNSTEQDSTPTPTTAPEASTWPVNQVKAIYSDTYGADCEFGEWGSDTQYTQEEYGKKFVTTELGYFGFNFDTLNCSQMEYLHMDIFWGNEEPGNIRIVPIHGGTEVGYTTGDLSNENGWTAIDVPLSSFSGVTDWSNVYQIKIDNAANRTFWLNNIYFYTTHEGVTVNVEVPSGTPACAFYGALSGNAFVDMDIVDDTHYTITFADKTADDLGWGYKFCWENGNWATQAAPETTYTATDGSMNVVESWWTEPGTSYNYTTYTEWNIKYAPDWEWESLTQVESTNVWTANITWGGTGVNIGSCAECPIKQDWYPADRIEGGDIAEGTAVKFTLTVIDDETIAIKLVAVNTESDSTNTVTDICGNTYPVVTIGTQTWMAENMRCNKYDTDAEAYGATWLSNDTIPTLSSYSNTPYYTDAADKTKWYSTEYSGNLSSEQIAELGYLYNWAATVGVQDGQNQTTIFTGNRQGICPNGWHVPTSAEWQTLYDYIYSDHNLSSNEVGKYLKTTLGWTDIEDEFKLGTDTYGFAALPTGHASGSNVYSVGGYVNFWTATPSDGFVYLSLGCYIESNSDYLAKQNCNKYNGNSVRCLKD